MCQMLVEKAFGESAINVFASIFIADAPDALCEGAWGAIGFENEGGPTTNWRRGKPRHQISIRGWHDLGRMDVWISLLLLLEIGGVPNAFEQSI